MPVISSPTRSRYSSNIMSRSASRMRCRITCLAVCAAIRPKSCGVTSSVSIWSSSSFSFSRSISGSGASRISPVSGSTVGSASTVASTSSCSSSSGGIFSSQTMKSPESRSISTFAYGAEPGVFLYADSSASSSASISFSCEMFFSAARPRTASTISLDMDLVSGYEVGADDLLVRDRQDPVAGGDRDVAFRGADQFTGQLLVAFRGIPQAHPRAAAQEAAVVGRLGQWAVGSRRRDLERIPLAVLGEVARNPLAQVQAHAVGMIDEQTQGGACDLRQQHLDLRLDAGKSGFDLGLYGTHCLLHKSHKKSGRAPTF